MRVCDNYYLTYYKFYPYKLIKGSISHRFNEF